MITAENSIKREDAYIKLRPRTAERVMPRFTTSWQDIQFDIGKYAFAGRWVGGKKVLDIACATGYGSNFLLKKGATRVIGADISEEAIGYATTRYDKEGLSFLIADAQQIPFLDHSFDVVVSLETIEHLPNYEDFLSECYRVLRTGGIFVCSTPNKRVAPPNSGKLFNPYHIKEFAADEFCQLLSRYFNNIALYGYVRYKKRGRMEKIISLPISLVYSLPGVLRNVAMKLVAIVTGFIFRGYHPVRLEDIDERDFDEVLTDAYRPFPIENAMPKYVFAIGQKVIEG